MSKLQRSMMVVVCCAGCARVAPPGAAGAPGAGAAGAAAGAQPAKPVVLSAGVAMGQTLPDGTAVMGSMDYRWSSGSPREGSQYLWAVRLGDGRIMSGPAPVSIFKPRGTIPFILRGVRPSDGPFEGVLLELDPTSGAGPQPVSEPISLK